MTRIAIVLAVLTYSLTGRAQSLWTGPTLTFSKANYADWTLPENQDRLTDSVWLTREDRQGIFNIAMEEQYDRIKDDSPIGTRWANGSLSDGIENLTFGTWLESYDDGPTEVGTPKVLHLVHADAYLDITITEWTPGGGGSGQGFGGGFTYIRSTPDTTTSSSFPAERDLVVFPNPARDRIFVHGSGDIDRYVLLSAKGEKILNGVLGVSRSIAISSVPPGVYILKIDGFAASKLVIAP